MNSTFDHELVHSFTHYTLVHEFTNSTHDCKSTGLGSTVKSKAQANFMLTYGVWLNENNVIAFSLSRRF